jgi:LPS sulfotransferase NodH
VDELLKVVVVTRGRTGSSAITQELGQAPGCRSEQEAFALNPPVELFVVPPFDAWRAGREDEDEATLAEAYLDALEADARDRGCRALFWKLLSNQYDERPYLGASLRARGYRAIHLKRAPARQVISGLVARQSGVYVTSETPPAATASYQIDVDLLRHLAEVERFAANRDEAWLYKHGMRAVPADYEDYLADRPAFFARIYGALGLPPVTPAPTQFVVTLPDLKSAIANYDEVCAVAAEFGETL